MFVDATSLFADEDDEPLKISNPAYLPYAGDFFFKNDWSYEHSSSSTEFPTQTLASSATWPAATISAPKTLYFTEFSLRYGITDRISLGAGGRYMLRSQTATNYEGGLNLPASSSSDSSGFYQPMLTAAARLLGARSNEWYVNFEGRFQPGMPNGSSVASPQNTFVSILGAGWNSAEWTFTAVFYGSHTAATTVNGTNYTDTDIVGGQLMLQYDFEDFYFRPVGGVFKLVDATSESNPILRQAQPFVRGELGVFITDTSLLVFSIEQKFPLSAPVMTSILTGKSYYAGTLTISLGLASAF